MKLFSLFYDFVLHLFALGMLPKLLWKSIFRGKYRGSFLPRLGHKFPKIEKENKKLIWIHAVSFGETKAIAPLVKRLKKGANPPLILLSTTTETGSKEGKKNIPEADWHVYLPFDFSYVICPIVKQVAPDMLILTETDFWFHFQQAAKEVGAKIYLVNGKISERSFHRFLKLPVFVKYLLNPIDHFFLQGELYRERFIKLGINPDKLTVTGNIKLDAVPIIEDKEELKKRLHLTNQFVITLGSTHAPEEKIWIEALQQIWSKYPNLKVLLVPRHPERFDEVAKLLESYKIIFSRWSEGGNFAASSVVLIDAMGLLSSCYQISDLAFVGGSFTPKVGGHNIVEPCFFGKPVLFGPFMHSQPDLLDLIRTYRAGIEIEPGEIVLTVERLIESASERSEIGENGLRLIADSRGAVEKTFYSILSLLEKS